MLKAKVQFIGNVGQMESQYTDGKRGDPKLFCKFSVAVNNGKEKEDTDWYNCTLWEKSAEIFDSMAQVGTQVYIEGALRLKKYQSKGVEKMSAEVKVNDFNILSRGKEREVDDNEPAFMRD